MSPSFSSVIIIATMRISLERRSAHAEGNSCCRPRCANVVFNNGTETGGRFLSKLTYTLLTLGLLLAGPAPSIAANITAGIDDEGDHYVILDGVIIPGDAANRSIPYLQSVHLQGRTPIRGQFCKPIDTSGTIHSQNDRPARLAILVKDRDSLLGPGPIAAVPWPGPVK